MSNVLPDEGWVRLKQIIGDRKSRGPIPFSQSTWWAGCKSGRFPPPEYPFGPHLPLWRAEKIRALLKPVAAESAT